MLLLWQEVFVGELEGGRDAPVVGVQLLQSVLITGHPAHHVRQGPFGAGLEPGPDDAQGERQSVAEPGELNRGLGLTVRPVRADDTAEQANALSFGQWRQ